MIGWVSTCVQSPSLRADMEEGDGGETVFPNAWPPEQSDEEHVDIKQVILIVNFRFDYQLRGDKST